MEKLAPGRFEVVIAGETKVVLISFGIRSDILRVITKKQLEYRSLSSKNMLPAEERAKLSAAVEALDLERNKNEKNQEIIDQLQTEVNEIYEKALATIDSNKDAVTESLALGMIDLTDDVMAEILSLVLTKRSTTGDIVEKVAKNDILYSEKYANDSDELLSLIEAIMEYLTDSLKKIQAVSQMVGILVRPD